MRHCVLDKLFRTFRRNTVHSSSAPHSDKHNVHTFSVIQSPTQIHIEVSPETSSNTRPTTKHHTLKHKNSQRNRFQTLTNSLFLFTVSHWRHGRSIFVPTSCIWIISLPYGLSRDSTPPAALWCRSSEHSWTGKGLKTRGVKCGE
jgi:hypothetical protein